MDKTEILLLVFAVTFLAYSLYQKYMKNQGYKNKVNLSVVFCIFDY